MAADDESGRDVVSTNNKSISPEQQRKEKEVGLATMVGSLIYSYDLKRRATSVASSADPPQNAVSVVDEDDNKETVVAMEKVVVAERKALQAVEKAIQGEIPVDDVTALRQSRAYQSAKQLVEFQRDQYLVGRDYATRAAQHRQQQPQSSSSSHAEDNSSMVEEQELQQQMAAKIKPQQQQHTPAPPSKRAPAAGSLASWATLRRRMPDKEESDDAAAALLFPPARLPVDPTALGHLQMARLVSTRLLPLPALHQAAVPWVCKIPQVWIYQPTEASLVRLITNQESNLSRLLKQRLLAFLDNPHNRTAIKMSTQNVLRSSTTGT